MSCRITENVLNGDVVTLTTGMIVRISDNNTVVRANNGTLADVQATIGVVVADIAVGATGPVMTNGRGPVLMAGGGVQFGAYIWVSFLGGVGTSSPPFENRLIVGVIKDSLGYDDDVGGLVIADVSPQWDTTGQHGSVIIGEEAQGAAGLAAGGTNAVSVAIGYAANANNERAIAIGKTAVAGFRAIAIGPDATTSGITTGSIAIGQTATTTSVGCVVIGTGAFTVGASTDAIAIGNTASVSAAEGIAIGHAAVVGAFQGAIAIGGSATPTAAQMCHVGAASAANAITEFHVVNNSGGANSNRTLRATIVPGGNNSTGLWITRQNSAGAVAFKQVISDNAGVLAVSPT